MAIAAIMLFFVTCFLYMYIYAKRIKEKEPPLFSGALPLIGHSYMFVTPKDGKSLWRLWSNTAVECWNNGGVIKIQTVWPPLTHYVIGEPDSLLAAANNTTKHYFYKVFRKHIGDGLLVTKDELHWRHHRRQMNPAFTARFVDSLMEVFNGCGRSLCQTWASKVGKPFEHLQSVGEVALAAVLGDIGKYCNVSIKDYVDAVSTLDRAVAVRLASLPLHSDFLYFLTKDGREYIRVADYVSREGRKIIKTTRERLQKTGDENRNYKNVSGLWNLWSDTATQCWEKGGVIAFRLPLTNYYVVGDPDDCRSVANAYTEKHYLYKFFNKYGNNGLVSADMAPWKVNRKQINPAFSQRFLDDLMVLHNLRARELCGKWSQRVDKGRFEHFDSIAIAMLEGVLGYSADGCNFSSEDLIDTIASLDKIITHRIAWLPWHVDCIFALSKAAKEYDIAVDYMNSITEQIITNRRAKFAITNLQEDDNKETKSVVDYIIEHCNFDNRQLHDEVNTILSAGHSTTASTITSALILLGSNPEIQEKVYDELKSVFGSSDRDVLKEDLSKLPYLTAVIKETLRLYPAAPVAARRCDNQISLKNFTLPAGGLYIMHIYAVNRHPAWGEDRLQFRPERWLEPEKLPPQYAFATFSLGKRSCIGKTYAMMAMKTSLSHILRKYRVQSDVSKYEIKLEFLIKPHKGGVISLEERNSTLNEIV